MKFLSRRGLQCGTLSSFKCWQIFSSLFLHTDIFSSKFPDLWISVILLYYLSSAFSNLLHWRLDRNGWRDPQHFWTHLERFPFPNWAGRTMWEMKINWLPLIYFLFFFYFHSFSIWRLLKLQLDCGKLGVKNGFCNQHGRKEAAKQQSSKLGLLWNSFLS